MANEVFPADALAKLREPFPEHQISKLPKPTKAQTDEVKADFKKGIRCELCNTWHHPKVVHLDYVGHAALTDRLLDVDPFWSWEPLAMDGNGLPLLDKDGGMWIKLTICGVTRLGYGDAEGKTGGNAVKERIGDALRNAAMRFGAALDLWHKGDLHQESDEETTKTDAGSGAKPSDKVSLTDMEAHADLQERMYAAFKAAGKDDKYSAESEKWRKRMSTHPTGEVVKSMAEFVAKLEDAAKTVAGLKEQAAS